MNLKCDFILMFVSARGPKARRSCSSVTSSCFAVFLCLGLAHGAPGANGLAVLNPDGFARHIAKFNAMEDENRTNYISNAQSWPWLRENIPFFECPDPEVEEIYFFRWWSLRKHLEKTGNGFVFSEFLTRTNPISSALGHQINELRWLRDGHYLDDYILFWLKSAAGRPMLHRYSGWVEWALYQRWRVNQDTEFVVSLLDNMAGDYRQWEDERLTPGGLFWQFDVRDAMEESISGSRTNRNLRPTINSYMYGNARAIAAVARMAGNTNLAVEFDARAAKLQRLTQEQLWDAEAMFFKVRLDTGKFSSAREEIGFIPWYFDLPDPGREAAWAQLPDPGGFLAAFGITTAERRSPFFRSHGCCHCEWDGAVWPFATSQTLTALGNVLCDYKQPVITPRDYFNAFMAYVRSQHADGKPYIGEYLDETTGQWFNGKEGRSRYYNHSTFADLIVTGVAGLRPGADHTVRLHPLLTPGVWGWFCLDGVNYHGHSLSIIWDADGKRYGRGKGLCVLADGHEIARSEKLEPLTGLLP